MYRPDLDENVDGFYRNAEPDDWAFFDNDKIMLVRLPFDMGEKRQYSRGHQELWIDPARPLEHLHLYRYYTWNGDKEHPTIEETIHYSQWEGFIINGEIIDAGSDKDPYKDLPLLLKPKYFGQSINGSNSGLRRLGLKRPDW